MNKFLEILLIVLLSLIFLQAKAYRGAEYRTIEAYTYGRFEVRMKSAQMSGMLSSFFTYHEISSLADWNEIDIEILGKTSNEVQFNTITPEQTNHVYDYTAMFNPHAAFHTYAFEWTPDYVAWFVDSIEVYRQTAEHISTLNRAQKLMMNIWPPANAGWVGSLDEANLPVFAYYDWVQYYAYTPGSNHNFSLQWRDDFNSWNTMCWEKASHTWDGNNSDFIYDNVVFQDGYLILCLTMPDNTGYSSASIEDADKDAPYLFEARFFNDDIVLTFSEKLNKTTAETVTNFIVPGITIDSAILGDDQRIVVLTTTGRAPDSAYNLYVVNVKDLAPVPNVIAVKKHIIKNALLLPGQFNLGGAAVDSFLVSQAFEPQFEYGHSGGTVFIHSASTDFAGTDDDSVYQSEVRGINFFNIRVPNGVYDITLMFAETEYDQTNKRVFSVSVEEQARLKNLDIFKECGGYKACEREIKQVPVQDNLLELYFQASVGSPVLSGLKITPKTTSVNHSSAVPETFEINIFPNPFNPSTTIAYRLPQTGNVRIHLYDTHGRLLAELLDARQTVGRHQIKYQPRGLSSGLYFCRMEFDKKRSKVQKLIYMK